MIPSDLAGGGPGFDHDHAPNKREAERRQTQCFMSRTQAACGTRHEKAACAALRLRARSPAGVPLRLSPEGLSSQRLSFRPCFLGLGRSARSCTAAPTGGRRPCAVATGVTRPEKPVPVQRRTSRDPLPTLPRLRGRVGRGWQADARSRPGAQLMKPRPRAPHSLLPPGITGRRPLRARFDSRRLVPDTVTSVKENVAGLRTYATGTAAR